MAPGILGPHMLYAWIIGTFCIALGMAFLIEKIASHFRVLSKGSYRRKASEGTPLLGGLSVIIAVIPGLIYFSHDLGIALLISFLPLLLTGLCDDIWEIGGRWKLMAQLMGGGIWLFLIQGKSLLFCQVLGSPVLGQLVTLAWLIGMTNAYNLIDGIDGQASAMAIINWCALALVVPNGEFSWIMIAAQAGFLVRNFTPARIYLGEIGSSFLGFSLGAVATANHAPLRHMGHFVAVLFLFAVPLFDTVAAMWRRLRRGESLFRGDREHVHHRLTKLQFSTLQTVLVTCTLTFAGSGTFILIFKIDSPDLQAIIFLVSASLMSLCLFGVQFCEKHFSQRVLSLGRGLLSKHLNGSRRTLTSVPTRALVIDLLPAFRELQMQGILTLHEFLKDFAELIGKTEGTPNVQFLGSYSVTLLFNDHDLWTSNEILAFAAPCHGLFENYHCLTSAKSIPDCLVFYSGPELHTLLPLLDLELDLKPVLEPRDSQKVA